MLTGLGMRKRALGRDCLTPHCVIHAKLNTACADHGRIRYFPNNNNNNDNNNNNNNTYLSSPLIGLFSDNEPIIQMKLNMAKNPNW